MREAEEELENTIAFTLPKWAYINKEWAELVLRKQVLRKKVAAAKKELGLS